MKSMSLSLFAQHLGIRYRTLWGWGKQGLVRTRDAREGESKRCRYIDPEEVLRLVGTLERPLRRREVAQLYGCSKSSIDLLVRKGLLRAFPIGQLSFFKREEVEDLRVRLGGQPVRPYQRIRVPAGVQA